MNFGLTPAETKIYKKLNTPGKIQDFLDTFRINFEKGGDTCRSPRAMLQAGEAHCIEAAFFAASVLWYHGHKPLLLDLVAHADDYDHVVTLFKVGKHWGAISKSNHSVLRWRDPVYASVRELAMSYFHEYFLEDGSKSLKSFSKPFNLKKFGTEWVTSEKSLIYIADKLDESPHVQILTPEMKSNLRRASLTEIKAGDLVEYRGK